ncbi:MAG TPA: hypothetical protein PKM59_10285, partial [Thermodesulfobacteriota bacterium]|nr:hypothetical protein [Thermodesulfobacteriota bacterium]
MKGLWDEGREGVEEGEEADPGIRTDTVLFPVTSSGVLLLMIEQGDNLYGIFNQPAITYRSQGDYRHIQLLRGKLFC